ncbi:MAG: hypothetical protein KA165_15565 [Saprospiraceae bacterium]|nr:hypothetical protein [Saprospiraceae bacterium]
MNLLNKIKLIFHILRWRFTWSKRNLDFLPEGTNSEKFVTARNIAAMIPDGATVFSSGFAGNARCSVFFWAIREWFLKNGHPCGLTWINVGAQGGRGKVPGTVEELGLPGLMTCYITGHTETAKAQLHLAEAGQLELHVLPQGVMAHILEAQGRGESFVSSEVGVSTFMDPRTGHGSPVTLPATLRLVQPDGNMLRYTMPAPDFTLINAPYADAEGNIYFHHASSLSENIPAAAAARANGGKVFVTVSAIIPKDDKRISMPATAVDRIAVHPYNEQTASVRQKRYWPMFTPGSTVDFEKAERDLKFINTFLRITPVRDATDDALTRMAAQVFAEEVPQGSMLNIGVGYPEEVARHLVLQGLGHDLLFTTEAGSYGGLPVPGIFFGSALAPEKLISSAEMFRLYESELGAAILGFLQVDEKGNVNASKRGPRVTDYVGPGGLPDIAGGARTVIFVGSWQANARFEITDNRLRIVRPGKPKFVTQTDEVTFSAEEALRQGKKVFYVTHVGVFRLVPEGLMLIKTVPGIDIRRDILDAAPAHILLPPDGEIPVADARVMSGEGFRLAWPAEVQVK